MSLENSRTIEIYLPTGEPNAIRIARDTVRPLKIIAFNIIELDNVGKRFKDINGCYMLYGKSMDGKEQVYFGETDNLFNRLKSHRENKDFWDTGYVILNDTGSFDKAHLHYLENLMIKKAKEAGRFNVENKNDGQRSTITEPKEAECLQYFEIIKLLIQALSVNVFNPVAKVEQIKEDNTVTYQFKSETLGFDGKCKIINDKYYVLKGSLARKGVVDSILGDSFIVKNRTELIRLGVMKEIEGFYEFTKDYEFNSPSIAAAVIAGRAANGWTYWKDIKTDATMDSIVRKKTK